MKLCLSLFFLVGSASAWSSMTMKTGRFSKVSFVASMEFRARRTPKTKTQQDSTLLIEVRARLTCWKASKAPCITNVTTFLQMHKHDLISSLLQSHTHTYITPSHIYITHRVDQFRSSRLFPKRRISRKCCRHGDYPQHCSGLRSSRLALSL